MKKGITLIAALVAVLAVTSGAFAAKKYLVTSSSQIKDGAVSLADLSPAARQALRGQLGPKGDIGATGAQGPQGVRGATGATGPAGATGAAGPAGPAGPKGDTGPQGPQGVSAPHMLRLSGDFSGTNASVATTLDGVQFGPYSNGGSWGGSVRYDGANGLTLAQITELAFTVKHSTANDNPISTPYLRIFLDNNTHDVIFDPTKCATAPVTEDEFHTYEVTNGDVRYDDDSCDGVAPDQQTWAAVKAAHGSQVVSGITVTTGYTGGTDLVALLRSIEVNGTEQVFGAR